MAAVGPRCPFGVRVPDAAGPGPGHIGSPPDPPGLFPLIAAVCRANAGGSPGGGAALVFALCRTAGQRRPVSRAGAGPDAEFRRSGPPPVAV